MAQNQKKKQETDLVPYQQQFIALQGGTEGLAEIIEENLGGEQASQFDLERISVAAGGTPMFTLKMGLDEEPQHAKEIEGVIVFWTARRAWWRESFEDTGGGSPPECSSTDKVFGQGDIGDGLATRKCSECPMDAWGSGKGKSKACQEVRLLFVLRTGREKSFFPSLIQVKPGSLASVRGRMFRMLTEGKPFHSMVHKFTVAPAKSGDGITYGQIKMAPVRELGPDEHAAVKAYGRAMKPAFVSVDPFVAQVKADESADAAGPVIDVEPQTAEEAPF